MNKYCLLLFIPVVPMSVNAGDLSESWRMDPIPNSTNTFELHITQNGKNICGIHFGSAKGGAKIDSNFGSNPKATISGLEQDDIAKITIISSQSEFPVEGTIKRRKNVLSWNVTNSQSHHIITIPKSAKLKLIPPVDLGYRNLDVLCGE